MKDSEFIQLLNLYLDHEISAPDAIRLEAEVQTNPARRRIYEDYCRMQKACKLLATDFATETTAAPEKKVVPFDVSAAVSSRRARSNGFYVVGAFAAAAACVAVIFVGQSRREAGENIPAQAQVAAQPEVAAPSTALAAAEVTAEAKTTPMPVDAPAPRAAQKESAQAMLVSHPFSLASNTDSNSLFRANATSGGDQFAWLNAVQLAPLPQRVPADSLRFDLRPASLRPEGRPLGVRSAPAEADVEMSAFQFRK